ncbi:hypothetical protein [Burkholderia mayonis]|uniref:hypothetical protein n=1 Tax=Burkholderia mayonis TaxID=1385591 RepID=UPI00131ED741|nr:hypothetical protein [Burkholderia mayonis]
MQIGGGAKGWRVAGGGWRVTGSPDRRVAGSPGRRVAGSPDRRIAGSPDRRIAGSPGRRVAGSPDRRITGSPDHRITGSPDHRITGSPDHRITGSPDHRITGSPDHRITGSPDHRIAGSPAIGDLVACCGQSPRFRSGRSVEAGADGTTERRAFALRLRLSDYGSPLSAVPSLFITHRPRPALHRPPAVAPRVPERGALDPFRPRSPTPAPSRD